MGPWRIIEIADSPDNFPIGKYKGDPAKYSVTGAYQFTWNSQIEYEKWLTSHVVTLKGQISGGRFRFPASLEITPGPTTNPQDALSPTEIEIQTLTYGA